MTAYRTHTSSPKKANSANGFKSMAMPKDMPGILLQK